MRRALSCMLTLAMLCALLAGCAYEGFDMTIHADGSGTVALKAGYSKDALLEMLADVDPAEAQAQLDALTPFEEDGKTYFGVTGEGAFSSPEEFAAALAGLTAEAGELTESVGEMTDNLRLLRDGDALMLVVDNRVSESGYYEADDAETERRAEALYQAWHARVPDLDGDALRRVAAERAEGLRAYAPEEFEDYLQGVNDESAEELAASLRGEIEYLDWTGLDDALRAAREAEVAEALGGRGLSADEAKRCAAYFVDFYDYPPASFAANLDELKGMDEEYLRGELDFLISVYEYVEPEETYDEPVEYDEGDGGFDVDAGDVVLRIVARFDDPVTQTAGGSEGVSVEGGVVTLDLAALSTEVYRFTTRADVALTYESLAAVELDGVPVELDCYALRDASGTETVYARVRDVAALLSGTRARFGVVWEDDVVKLTKGVAYEGESVSRPFTGARTYERPGIVTLVSGAESALDSLVLHDEDGGGYTYYKLRDLGEAMGFGVRWDSARSVVCIESGPNRVV